jgi:hypothetical protein
MKTIVKTFIAGFLSTLVFHQGLFALFYALGKAPAAPFNLNPVPPFGIPSVLSLAFFGGLWGILIWKMLNRNETTYKFWMKSFIYGGIGPTAVALFIVFPLKNIPVLPVMYIFGFLLNGFWGIGNSVFAKIFKTE